MLKNVIKQSHYTHTCGACYGIFRKIPGNGGKEKDLIDAKMKSDEYKVHFKGFSHANQPLAKLSKIAGNEIWFCRSCFPKVKHHLAQVSLGALAEIPESINDFEIVVEDICCVFEREKIEKAVEEEAEEA